MTITAEQHITIRGPAGIVFLMDCVYPHLYLRASRIYFYIFCQSPSALDANSVFLQFRFSDVK